MTIKKIIYSQQDGDNQYMTFPAGTLVIDSNNQLKMHDGTTQGGVSSQSSIASQVVGSGYNNPTLITPQPSDPNWAFGSYSDGQLAFWMQTTFYGTGTADRGFRVIDAGNENATVFSVDGTGTTKVQSLQFPNASTQTTAYPGPPAELVNGTYTAALDSTGVMNLPSSQYTSSQLFSAANQELILGIGGTSSTWTFHPDGRFILPGSNGKVQFSDGTQQSTAWTGGRVVAAPTHSTGSAGDKAGDIAFDNNYIYYCKENYGYTAIYGPASLGRAGSYSTGASYGFGPELHPYNLVGTHVLINGIDTGVTVTAQDNSYNAGRQTGLEFSGAFTAAADNWTFIVYSGTDIWVRVAWTGTTW